MKTTTTSPIGEFRLRWNLDAALADARSMNEHVEMFPATRAGLALALDTRDHETITAAGAWGSAGCYVTAVMGDGEIRILEDDQLCRGARDPQDGISEDRARDLLLTDGELDPEDVHALRGSLWDGNNHVNFVPVRSLACLAGDDRFERIGHALIAWSGDGCVEEVRLDDGWSVADEYWGTLGNQSWTHTELTADERISLLTESRMPCEACRLSDDDVMILVPTVSVAMAQKLFDDHGAQ